MKTIELNNPVITHKLAILRNKKTGTKEFRELVSEIGMFLCYEALKDAKLDKTVVETPMEKYETGILNEDKYAFIPILRAGMGLMDGVLRVLPNAKFGHIGMYRNEETFEPVNYFFKVPSHIEEKEVILLDPMLATGESAVDAIKLLKDKGVKKIKFICVIAAPEGLKVVEEAFPNIQIYTASIDRCLNENCYILPGLGDTGQNIWY